jgi:hypothetical protein
MMAMEQTMRRRMDLKGRGGIRAEERRAPPELALVMVALMVVVAGRSGSHGR